MADDAYRNRIVKDEKVICQIIKDSVRKCADAAAFLGKINRDVLNSRREKIPSELSRDYKQLTFKTEGRPQLFWGMISLKPLKILVKQTKLVNL